MWLWDGVGGMGRTHDELLGMGKVAGRRGCCSLWGGENPRDGGARWAAVYGVTQSQTRLKRLSSSSSSHLLKHSDCLLQRVSRP